MLLIRPIATAFTRFAFVFFILSNHFNVNAQCTATTLNPATPITVSTFNDTVVVGTSITAGNYFQLKGLGLGATYSIVSPNPGDYFTIRNANTGDVLAQGQTPIIYSTGTGPDLINVHLNLLSPPCGVDPLPRTIKLVCTSCGGQPPKVGVNNNNPSATLDVSGEIKLGNSVRSPEAGMIRWNPDNKDFEGYNGTGWISMTKSISPKGQWGELPPSASVNETLVLTASDGDRSHQFGTSVSISGDYAIVGAPFFTSGVNLVGAAYIFLRNGSNWIQQAKLNNPNPAGFGFGRSVDINGDYAIVSSNSGPTYIFLRNGSDWLQQAALTASDGVSSDNFGGSVSINGDYVIIGASRDDLLTNTDQGSAYIFVKNGSGWIQQAKLTASDGAAGDLFGSAVSINGDYAIVGSNSDDINTNADQGSAYIFLRSGSSWTQQAKLTASDGAASDNFGCSVDISGSFAVVGASLDDINSNTDQGSAFVYSRSGSSWTQQAKLTASDGAVSDNFGASVAISGNNLIVGANFVDFGINSAQGAAYIFSNSTNILWPQQSKISASNGGNSSLLGFSVSIDSDYLILGASQHTVSGKSSQGAAYILKKN